MYKLIAALAFLLMTDCELYAAQQKPGDAFKDCEVCPEMVVLPTGTGWLGRHPKEKYRGNPFREGRFDTPLAVGKFEVLRKEYAACVADKSCRPAAGVSGFIPLEENPVYGVSWNDAKAYVEWLAKKTGKPYRLLSRNEWEYAARGGTETVYWWGDEFRPGMAICRGCKIPTGKPTQRELFGETVTALPSKSYSRPVPHSIGKLPPNPFGLYYMLGNVAEWVEDCMQEGASYQARDTSEPQLAPPAIICTDHTYRGGDYNSAPHWITPSVGRSGKEPDYSGNLSRREMIGLRVALNY